MCRSSNRQRDNESIQMAKEFDPAPFDEHAEDPMDAIEADRETTEKLRKGLVGGSFPASDPLSANQPSPSEFDAKAEL